MSEMTRQEFDKIALTEINSGKTVAEIRDAIGKAFVSLSQEGKNGLLVERNFLTDWLRANNDELVRLIMSE